MAQIQSKFIADSSVTNAKMADMADNTVKANKSGGSAAPSDLALSSVTEAVSSILTISNGSNSVVAASDLTIQVQQSDATHDGYLSSTDWNTFNGKLTSSLTSAHIFVGNGSNVATNVAASGDLTLANTGAFTIANNVVSNAKLAQMPTLTLKGNNTGGTANALDLTVSQVQTMLAIPTSSSPLPLNAGGTGISAGSANAAFNALSPLTTKGDVLGYSTVNARLGVGSDGQVLTADSTQTLGIKWASPAASVLPAYQQITLSGTDITNQYVDLAFAAYGADATDNSILLAVIGGPIQAKTVDYTVSLTGGSGGVTRVTFSGDLATGGPAELVAGDILVINYSH